MVIQNYMYRVVSHFCDLTVTYHPLLVLVPPQVGPQKQAHRVHPTDISNKHWQIESLKW